MASTLLGPIDRSELSTNAMPAEPSAPVTTMSVACKRVPTRAGRRWPLRSRYTEPLATLNWAMSFAQLAIGARQHAHARRNRRTTIERVDCIVTPNNWPAFQFRRRLAPVRAVCSYNNNPNGLLPAHPINGERPACPVPGQDGHHGRNPGLCRGRMYHGRDRPGRLPEGPPYRRGTIHEHGHPRLSRRERIPDLDRI